MLIQWIIIIASLIASLFIPNFYLLLAGVVILVGYVQCKKMQWPRYQLYLAYIFGGIAAGAMVKCLVFYGYTKDYVPFVIAPLLIWLFSRAFYLYVEERYSLIAPKKHKLALRTHTIKQSESQGVSAWSGESSGGSKLPDETGARVIWTYETNGEIAMGGPTYGDVVFSNHCVFAGVGPSIVISDDGHYAAMTLPSRASWGLLIADLKLKRTYQVNEGAFWEIDRIEQGEIYGRVSPLTSNQGVRVAIVDAIAAATELPMVNDDGWWVVDYENRKPFPTYQAVVFYSSQQSHRITFVPDLAPFKNNPYLRYQHPNYQILVDDIILQEEVRNPTAVWVDGNMDQEGRFAVINGKVVDFYHPITKEFDVSNASTHALLRYDESTHISFNAFKNGWNGLLIAEGTVQPRSVDFSSAEINCTGVTYPWDDETVEFWDAKLKKSLQKRTRIQRFMRYEIQLAKLCQREKLPLCSKITLVNRSTSGHTAELVNVPAHTQDASYAAYTCVCSCGVDAGLVTEEAIWSHCGRYLAVVGHEVRPHVPRTISIIDFKSATIKVLPEQYVLPSFMWFDKDMLEFSHIVALEERLYAQQPKTDEVVRYSVKQGEYKHNLYALLIESLPERYKKMEAKADKLKTDTSYASGSAHLIAQHCIVFAPDFDQAILQPPMPNSTAR
jgi:hypothetical protein